MKIFSFFGKKQNKSKDQKKKLQRKGNEEWTIHKIMKHKIRQYQWDEYLIEWEMKIMSFFFFFCNISEKQKMIHHLKPHEMKINNKNKNEKEN